MIINFDNAATTYPKPLEVRRKVNEAIQKYGGNAGRGGHILTSRTSEAVFESREKIADFFGTEPENVIFTLNCTHSLNLAIQGIMSDGGHLIISDMEHNSASRPAMELLRKNKIKLSVAKVYENDEMTIKSFKELIRPDTKAIVCILASNVTGQILPYREIGELCRKKNICFIADGAQACGIIDIKLSDGINILCTAGHKGLYGLTGTGLLISDCKYKISPIMQGGTGSGSSSLKQPEFLPDSLESGTINIIGALSVGAGIDFIKKTGIQKIYNHENQLCNIFINSLKNNENIIIYRNPKSHYVPIVSFNIKGISPERTAEILSEKGFCLRAGFHCSALAHNNLGTENGTVRFAPSVFNSEGEVIKMANLIKNISFNKNS